MQIALSTPHTNHKQAEPPFLCVCVFIIETGNYLMHSEAPCPSFIRALGCL